MSSSQRSLTQFILTVKIVGSSDFRGSSPDGFWLHPLIDPEKEGFANAVDNTALQDPVRGWQHPPALALFDFDFRPGVQRNVFADSMEYQYATRAAAHGHAAGIEGAGG